MKVLWGDWLHIYPFPVLSNEKSPLCCFDNYAMNREISMGLKSGWIVCPIKFFYLHGWTGILDLSRTFYDMICDAHFNISSTVILIKTLTL